MGKALFALGLLFGLLGLGWSVLTLGALALVAGLGQAPEILLISVQGFLTAGLAIAGGVASLRWPRAGAGLVLAAGVVALVALPIVVLLRPEIQLAAAEFLLLSLLLGWWAYGLAVGGAVGLVLVLRRGRDAA